MELGRRVNLFLLGILILITIAYRYPIGITHELGSDTSLIHTLANSITESGYAKWALHPSSYFGLYALSYPSGIPFLLSAISMTSDLSIEGCTYLIGILFAVYGILSAYMLAREIKRDDIFAFTVAFFFSLAPFLIKDTTWVSSTRGFVVSMLPMFVFFLLKHLKTGRALFLVLAILYLVMMASIHRIGDLTIFILIAYLFVVPVHKITQRLRFTLFKWENPFRAISLSIALLGFFVMFSLQFFFPGYGGFDIRDQYGSGALFRGTSPHILLLNIAVNFTGKVGIIMPFAVIGLIIAAWKRPKEAKDKFLLLTILILMPFLSLRLYISEFMILFFVMLACLGVYYLPGGTKIRKLIPAVAISLLIVSAAYSWQMKDYWRKKYSTDGPIPEETYDAAIYVSHFSSDTIISNDGLMGGRISAISGKATLPLGGASLHWRSPQQLIFDFEDGESIKKSTTLMNIWEISFNTDEIFITTRVRNALVSWESMLYSTVDDSESEGYIGYWEVRYAILEKKYVIHEGYNCSRGFPYKFLSYTLPRSSPFIAQLYESPNIVCGLELPGEARYKIYENTKTALFYVS